MRTLVVLCGACMLTLLACGASKEEPTDQRAAPSELVTFNTQSKKYHCPSCKYAKKCTRNCITVQRAEAEKRGGLACSVCGGRCK
jgi:hypothetical protein